MRPGRRCREALRQDGGSASLEFLTAGVLLLVPLVYLLLALSAVQGASLAVEGAARQASRAFVQGQTEAEARAAADRAIRVTLADYGLGSDDATVAIRCTPDPDDCLTRRGFVTVEVAAVVALPLMPPALAVDVPAGVTVTAAATAQVSRFRVGS